MRLQTLWSGRHRLAGYAPRKFLGVVSAPAVLSLLAGMTAVFWGHPTVFLWMLCPQVTGVCIQPPVGDPFLNYNSLSKWQQVLLVSAYALPVFVVVTNVLLGRFWKAAIEARLAAIRNSPLGNRLRDVSLEDTELRLPTYEHFVEEKLLAVSDPLTSARLLLEMLKQLPDALKQLPDRSLTETLSRVGLTCVEVLFVLASIPFLALVLIFAPFFAIWERAWPVAIVVGAFMFGPLILLAVLARAHVLSSDAFALTYLTAIALQGTVLAVGCSWRSYGGRLPDEPELIEAAAIYLRESSGD